MSAFTKPVRWSVHALDNLLAREIGRREADLAISEPERVAPGRRGREIRMRRYRDLALGQEMLIRVVVENSVAEVMVVTVYKTSRIDRYLEGARR